MLHLTRFTAIRPVVAALLHDGYASFDHCTICKHVQTYSKCYVCRNTFWQLSPTLQRGINWVDTETYRSMLINSCVITNPALTLYGCFVPCVAQVCNRLPLMGLDHVCAGWLCLHQSAGQSNYVDGPLSPGKWSLYVGFVSGHTN
jgi:hypothetical protein